MTEVAGLSLLWSNALAYAVQSGLILILARALEPMVRRAPLRSQLLFWYLVPGLAIFAPAVQLWLLPPGELAVFNASTQIWASGPASLQEATGGASVLLSWIVALWVFGATARMSWLAIGLVALRRYACAARPLGGLKWLPALTDVVGVGAQFKATSDLSVPVTFGHRHPIVLIPEHLLDLPQAQQRAIACHELIHVRRRDWLTIFFEEILRSLLWFHPATWWIKPRLDLCREQIVDREVVDLLGNRRDYLRGLWTVASATVSGSALPALFFSKPSHLGERVAQLKNNKEDLMTQKVLSGRTLGLLLALAAAVATGMLAFPLSASDIEADSSDAVIQDPVLLESVDPQYTQAARDDRVEGTVVLSSVIDRSGDVTSLEVIRSLRDDLDQAAIDAVRQWKFQPARLNGEIVEVQYKLGVNFRLEQNETQENR